MEGFLGGEGSADFFPVMQTLVVVFEDGGAFGFARGVFRGGVDNVAGEDFLPEGEAAGGTWERGLLGWRFFVRFNGLIWAELGGSGRARCGLVAYLRSGRIQKTL